MDPTTSLAGSRARRKDPSVGPKRSRVFFTTTGKRGGRERIVAGRRCLFKKVDPGRHRLTVPPAWASDEVVLEAAGRAGATHALLRERGSGRFWAVLLSVFCAYGFRFDRGYGWQVGLVLDRWARAWTPEDALQQADTLAAMLCATPARPAGYVDVQQMAAPRPTVRIEQQDLFEVAG